MGGVLGGASAAGQAGGVGVALAGLGWLQDVASYCQPWIPNRWPSSSASWGLSVPEVSWGPEQCGPPLKNLLPC